MPICGLLGEHVGWESIFYVSGASGCTWFIFWSFLAFNSPENHPRILEEEKTYIVSNIYEEESKTHNRVVESLPAPPYKEICLSIPTVAVVITSMCHAYGYYTLLTMTPTYLNNIQHFSLDSVSSDCLLR